MCGRRAGDPATSLEIREGLGRIEIAPLVLGADAVRDRIRREREFWGPIVAASGFNPDK